MGVEPLKTPTESANMPVKPEALPMKTSADNVSGIFFKSLYSPDNATGGKSSVRVYPFAK